jgi:hypothetical protein
MKRGLVTAMLLLCLWFYAGCTGPIRPSDMTFNRGAQLLAAGSPQSAIPFLTQTVVATPDGPEPLALLSLAYALDNQPERAMAEVKLVHRPAGMNPGWENVATGIAHMSLHRPADAVGPLTQVANSGSPIAPAAGQWLVMARLMSGDSENARKDLQELALRPEMATTSLLWMALIEAHAGETAAAGKILAVNAQRMATPSGKRALASGLANADAQTLYDAGLAALAEGDFPKARELFTRVQQNAETSDSAIWLALIAATTEPWQNARNQLAEACETGSPESRGLAHQLFSVICALEDRPDGMIQHTLSGQRLLNRAANSRQPVDMPAREEVWNSDSIK